MGRQEIKAGLFTLAALGVLSLFMVLISGWSPWKEQTVYKTRFRTVLGINPGSTVRMHGVPIGSVISLGLVEDSSQVEITFGLTGERKLNEGVIAELAQSSLLGENFLLLTQYSQRGGQLKPGSLIPSRQKMDVGEVMNAMGRLAARAEAIVRDVRLVINEKEMTAFRDNLRRWQADISRVLTEASGSVDGVDEVVANANKLLINADTTINSLKGSLDQTLVSVQRELKFATGLMNSLSLKLAAALDADQPLAQNILQDGSTVISELKTTTQRLNSFVEGLNAAMTDVKVIARNGRQVMTGVNTLVVKGQKAADSATRFMEAGAGLAKDADRVVAQSDEIMAEVKGIVGQGRKAMSGVNRMVVQGEQAMVETRAGVERIVGQGEKTMTETRAGVGRVVGQAEDAMSGVERIVSQGEDAMAGVQTMVDQGQQVMTGVDHLVKQGQGVMTQTSQAVRTGGRVLHKVDRAADIALEDLVNITASLVQASRHLENLVLRLRNNPGLVLSPVRTSN